MYDAFPNPFVDPFKPTKGEIDTFNRQVLLQIRRIFGIPVTIENDYCLYGEFADQTF
jgi:hypothetical protein